MIIIPTTAKKMKLVFDVFLSFITSSKRDNKMPIPIEINSGTLMNESIELKAISHIIKRYMRSSYVFYDNLTSCDSNSTKIGT